MAYKIKQPKKKIVMLFKARQGKDVYYEDDYGHENHYIDYPKWKVWKEKVKDLDEAVERFKEIGEMNANNPPYDEYDFVTAYKEDTKEVIDTEDLERYSREKEEK